MFKTEKVDFDYKKEHSLLKISIQDLSAIRFLDDPDSINACYTLESVPPKYISEIRKYQLDSQGNITNIFDVS